jgi:hypothetical protein
MGVGEARVGEWVPEVVPEVVPVQTAAALGLAPVVVAPRSSPAGQLKRILK